MDVHLQIKWRKCRRAGDLPCPLGVTNCNRMLKEIELVTFSRGGNIAGAGSWFRVPGCRVGRSRWLGGGRGSQESSELQTWRAKKPRKDSHEGRGALGRKSQHRWQSRGLGRGSQRVAPKLPGCPH